ncbi:MAG: amino acid adenylation domain-containing protein, partial [Pirellulales bacterium]|nr:amino acid adenylation domain-containing protein [Pirellulales bacterium]
RESLAKWNDTAADYPADKSVHERFASQALATPNAVAIAFADRQLTYRELDRRANKLANYLIERGVGPKSLVGLCVERSEQLPVAVLGILKAGAAYVPLDAHYPPERLAFMLGDVDVELLVTESGVLDNLATDDVTKVCLDQEAGEISRRSHAAPAVDVTPDDLAYVMFTSGSTGEPKGVGIRHRSINRLVFGNDYAKFGADRVFVQLAPVSFDASTLEIWGALLHGARLVVAPPGPPDLPRLGELLTQHCVTTLWLTASLFNRVIEQDPSLLRGVEEILVGGEALSVSHIRKAQAALGDGTQLINGYGPTESTTFTTCYRIPQQLAADLDSIPIGRPIGNTKVYVLDENCQPVPIGEAGELYIGGDGLATGYLNRPELTAERFVADPFKKDSDARLYRTGDLCRWLADGNLEFIRRVDDQIKLRGYRIELGEIEAHLVENSLVSQAAVAVREDRPGEKRLVAYVVPRRDAEATTSALREFLSASLPDYMLPATFVSLPELPLTPNGKIDRDALPSPDRSRPALSAPYVEPGSVIERRIARVWRDILGLDRVGVVDNFFDLGGDSLQLVRVANELADVLPAKNSTTPLFEHPTIRSLADSLHDAGSAGDAPSTTTAVVERTPHRRSSKTGPIAIVGMAGRFPGADNLQQFWQNITRGVESITQLTDEQLRASGISEKTLADPNYVKARSVLVDVDRFDAALFGLSPRDAEKTDPQQRVFMQCCWEALEDAACDPARYDRRIGVFAGASFNTYLLSSVLGDRAAAEQLVHEFQVGQYQTLVGNDKDYLSSRIAYLLNLRGPAVTVQSACSTSLVAVVEACQSLWQGNCDAALAGGVSISFPQHRGYMYNEGGMVSRDGHCRPFDADSTGTVFGSGAGVVLLKRLDDALADGDPIHAVLRGAAINNDGSTKVGYAAPSVDGQSAVICEALRVAGVSADTISYVETHGTATPLGDPIEFRALRKAFESMGGMSRCAIGSAKANIGHLESASGVAGLIKTVLALKHHILPPQANFNRPNPELKIDETPFYIAREASEWRSSGQPRRAGVSSMGVGGTNAHIIVEESPREVEAAQELAPADDRAGFLLPIAGRDDAALARNASSLADFLREEPDTSLADVAATLATGRRELEARAAVVCRDVSSAIERLDEIAEGSTRPQPTGGPVVFMFPGQATEAVGMAAAIYRELPVVRETIDRCAEVILPHLELDIRDVLTKEDSCEEQLAELLKRNDVAQASLFVVQYALARQWVAWGVEPHAVVGHSLGQFVAATLAGVFTLEDVLPLLIERGRLMQSAPAGAMLAVALPEAEVAKLANDDIEIASVNGPSRCVLTGAVSAIDRLQQRLEAKGAMVQRLETSRAFHSHLMQDVASEFTKVVAATSIEPPSIRLLSNTSGTWMKDSEATDPNAWGSHLRETVRFADNVAAIIDDLPNAVFLEIGPGQTLTGFVSNVSALQSVMPTMPRKIPAAEVGEYQLTLLGEFWTQASEVDLAKYARQCGGRRIHLPTYRFARDRYWLEPKWSSITEQPSKPEIVTAKDAVEEAPAVAVATSTESEPLGTDAELARLLTDTVGVEIGEAEW